MKALIKWSKAKEAESEQYWQRRNELDKEFGRYRSPLKKAIIFIATAAITLSMIHAFLPIISGYYLLYSNDSIMDRNNFYERYKGVFTGAADCKEKMHHDQLDQARDCFMSKLEEEDEFHFSGLMTAMSSSRLLKENNYPELKKALLEKIKDLEHFHEYEDSRIDLEVQRAYVMMGRSWLFMVVQYFTGENPIDASFITERK